MSAERKRLLARAKALQEDLKEAAERADGAGNFLDSEAYWQAYSQAGDVVEELQ